MSFDPDVREVFERLTDRVKSLERDLAALKAIEYGATITKLPNATIYAPNITTLDNPSYTLSWNNANGRIHYTAASYARAYGTGTTAVANNTWTPAALAAENYDTASYHDNATNNTRITIPITATYLLVGQINFVASTAGTVRGVALRQNGATFLAAYYQPPSAFGFQNALQISLMYQFTAADYVEICGYQDTGGSLNITNTGTQTPALSVYKLI